MNIDQLAKWSVGLTKACKDNNNYRKMKSYKVNNEGKAEELDAEAIIIEIEKGRGLIIFCGERKPNEGVMIESYPLCSDDDNVFALPALRAGAANCFFIDSEVHKNGTKK